RDLAHVPRQQDTARTRRGLSRHHRDRETSLRIRSLLLVVRLRLLSDRRQGPGVRADFLVAAEDSHQLCPGNASQPAAPVALDAGMGRSGRSVAAPTTREDGIAVDDPLVTIVTPSFNQGRFIRATIESVLAQDYPHIEYIVMDGGSTDDTAAVVAAYADRLHWISEKDSGQSHAINKGF